MDRNEPPVCSEFIPAGDTPLENTDLTGSIIGKVTFLLSVSDYLSPVVDALCKSMSEVNHEGADCAPKNQLRV